MTILSLFSSLLVIKLNYWVIIHAYRFVIVVKKNMSSPVHLMILAWTPWHCPCYVTKIIIIKSPHNIMWWWRFIVFAESARRCRHLFLLSLENPYSYYFQIFAVCILALGNLPGDFFAFFSFFNKIQDGHQNPMAHARAWTASSICFMSGLKETPYPGRELKSSWCDSDNKNFDFFTF